MPPEPSAPTAPFASVFCAQTESKEHPEYVRLVHSRAMHLYEIARIDAELLCATGERPAVIIDSGMPYEDRYVSQASASDHRCWHVREVATLDSEIIKWERQKVENHGFKHTAQTESTKTPRTRRTRKKKGTRTRSKRQGADSST